MFHIADKRLFTILFLSLITLFSVPESMATTLRPVYTDDQGTGFYDPTPLIDQVARGDNTGRTLGEVRRRAFQNALRILERAMGTNNDNGITIQASFEDLGGERQSGAIALAGARAANFLYIPLTLPGTPFVERIAFPIALAEHFLEEEVNPNEADVVITFNERAPFYYGTETTPLRYYDFITIVAHELLHGLGFAGHIQEDGSYPLVQLEDGNTVASITSYDINLYSKNEEELLVNLSQSQREGAITSRDGLLWDGTHAGLLPPSCAQLVGTDLADEYPSAVDNEGRPLLHAPATWEQGSSVSHLSEASYDLMKPTYGFEHFSFTQGMLLDMGWTVGFISQDLREVLSDCLAPETMEPEPEPEPTAGSGGSGGGCTIAESQNTQKNAMFNLFLILCALSPVFFYTNSMIKLSSVQGFSKR